MNFILIYQLLIFFSLFYSIYLKINSKLYYSNLINLLNKNKKLSNKIASSKKEDIY